MYVVNSVPSYYELAGARCLNSLLKYGATLDQVMVVIGNSSENKNEYINGVLHIFVQHNSSDYTSFIEALNFNNVLNWCFIHDTCEVTSIKFTEKISRLIKSEEYSQVDCATFNDVGYTNLGVYKHDFLLSIEDFILSLRNLTKHRGMYAETVINRLGRQMQISDNAKHNGTLDVYGNNAIRKVMKYDFGFNKYQTDSCKSNKLNEYKP